MNKPSYWIFKRLERNSKTLFLSNSPMKNNKKSPKSGLFLFSFIQKFYTNSKVIFNVTLYSVTLSFFTETL